MSGWLMVSTMVGSWRDIEMLSLENDGISWAEGVLFSGRGLYRHIDARFSGSAMLNL